MSTLQPVMIRSAPGIQRDGTQFDRKKYSDGVWCRFQRGLPRKIGGFSSITAGLDERVYGMSSFAADNFNYLGLGQASKIVQAQINSSTATFSGLVDRTPVGFSVNAANLAQFGLLPSAVVSEATDLIAHSAPNLLDISSTVERPIYVGQANLTTVLTATGLDQVSGGTCVIGPYVFGYGSGGTIVNSAPNDPATQANRARVTGQKIVYGRPLRGGGGPAGLFWSLDAIVRATFNAGTNDFDYDEMATELNILSSRSIVEYNGVFYWWDVSGPMMFNGVVREVPNDVNINYILDNLNYDYRQKMFVMKNPRWGEIWWCVPLFGATECNWAIILNVRENLWYDTPLPDAGRTSGIWPQAFRRPLMTDSFETDTGFSLWQHEVGADKVNGTSVEPVPASFTTADMSPIVGDQPVDKSLRVEIIEPDFVQVGDMTVEIVGKSNARSQEVTSAPKTFVADDGNLPAEQQIVRLRENRREMSFRFASNTQGGNFEAGQSIAHVGLDDGRITK